jgi:hypothetical protein
MKPSLKTITSSILVGLLLVAQPLAYAEDKYEFNKDPKASTDSEAEILKKIFQSIVNFGASFGFKISPEGDNQNDFSNPMTDLKVFQNIEMNVVKDLFYVVSRNNNFQTLFGDDSTYSAFDKLSTNLFSTYPMVYSYLDINQSTQPSQTEKNDISPVTQYVLNILNYTPWDVCIDYGSGKNNYYQKDGGYNYLDVTIIYNSLFNTQLTSSPYPVNCKTIKDLSDSTITDNIIKKGTYFYPPGYSDSTSQDKPDYLNLSKKLDSSVFLSPLIYQSGSDASGSDAENDQLKNAQAFVRYISGSILPPSGPTAFLMTKMINTIKTSNDSAVVMRYFTTLGNYVLSTRIFAARQSIGIANIYEILSKRMPIPSSSNGLNGASNQKTSQALNEFNMATYRLFVPSNSGGTGGQSSSTSTAPWQDMINTASSSVIQKETALLLAEINYQLYLMRQQQEKILLTNSLFFMSSNPYPTLQEPEKDQ